MNKLLLVAIILSANITLAGNIFVNRNIIGTDAVRLEFSGKSSADQSVPRDWINTPAWHFKMVNGEAVSKSESELSECVTTDSDEYIQIKAYLVSEGYVDKISMPNVNLGGVLVITPAGQDTMIAYWGITEVSEPVFADLPSVADSKAYLDNLKQNAKSDLHKLADVALINVLIRGSLVSSNTVALAEGNTTQIKMTLLHMEIESPDNEDLQKLSTKLDRLISIIESEGGDPDDAIVHPEI